MTEPIYKFLHYELRVSTQTLMRRGIAIRLRHKTLSTLAFLLANRSSVVTKQQLLDAIWPGADVQEQAVFQSISELRSLFKGHNCIETVRGRGYRWILPLQSDQRTASRRPLRWLAPIAAGIVLLVGSAAWWKFTDESTSFAVIVSPAAFAVAASENSNITSSSIDRILIHQLNRMGWDAQPSHNDVHPADQVEVAIDVIPSDTGASLFFSLQGRFVEESGYITAATPLGAVRDLAIELHELLLLSSTDVSNELSVSRLFTQAKHHLDRENYSLAEAYLTVAQAEQPNQLPVQRALAYTYQQMGRYDDALNLAYEIHDAANRRNTRTDRMMSSILLSQLLFGKNQYEDSEEFAHEALDIASELNDLLIVAEAQEQLGEISLARGQFGAGKEQLTVALKYFSTFCPKGETRVSRRLLDLES